MFARPAADPTGPGTDWSRLHSKHHLVRVQSLAGPGLFWQMYHGVICQEGLCSICLHCVHSEIAAFGALSGEV